jgi:hypothetical protein
MSKRTIRIEVDLSPAFERVLPTSHLSIDLKESEATVNGFLCRLLSEYGEKIRPLLFEREGDSILSGLMVMVNHRTFTGTALNQQEVRLVDKDKVSLLYFISGG